MAQPLNRSRLLATVAASLLASIISRGVASAADAAPAATNTSSATDVGELVVAAQRQFLGADTSGTTNLPVPIEQVPQTISIVSNAFIKAADLKSLGAIASYTPGAISLGNPENNGDVIDIRGFAAGRAIDGIPTVSTFNSYEPDYAIFDRLEVVEGPSSVVYGLSSPGGLVNYVTKGATSTTPSYISLEGGSWNSIRVEAQAAGALDKDQRVRVIGLAVVDEGDSFVNTLNHHKYVVYGGVDADFTDTLSGSVHAGYEKYIRPSFDGIPTLPDGTPAPVSRSFFLGSEDIKIDTSVAYTTANLTWRPDPLIEVSLKGNYEDARISGGDTYAYGLDDEGNFNFSINKDDGVSTRNYGLAASSVFKLDKLNLHDSFISLSALYQDSRQDTTTLYGDTGTANINDGAAAIRQAFDDLYASDDTFSYASLIDTQTTTYSAQSIIKPIDQLSVLLGASYSKPKVTTVTNGVSQNYDFDGQMSYRAGLTYEVIKDLNAYVSYSESFIPQPELTTALTLLPPLSGKQYEAGVKYRGFGGKLLVSGDVFRIQQRNLAQYDTSIDGADYYKAVGEVTHDGFELKALGEITPNWQINAGYAYLDPKITSDPDTTIVGKEQLFLPKNTFSVFSTYRLAKGPLSGLTFGGGLRYVDSVLTAYDASTKPIPSYVLVDATVSYAYKAWDVQLSVKNLFDKRYFINNYQTLFYGNYPGEPTNASLTLKRTF